MTDTRTPNDTTLLHIRSPLNTQSSSTLSAISHIFNNNSDDNHSSSGDDIQHNDDNNTSTHTHATSDAFLTFSTSSAYSSIHSDLKGGGPHEDVALLTTTEGSPPQNPPWASSSNLALSRTPRNDLVDLRPDSNGPGDLTEDIKRRSRVRSGTLGDKPTPVPITSVDTDNDASTVVSEMGDGSAFFDYDEEPSEYIPPTTPKVGGFGVETANMEPHKEGMRSVASDRVNKAPQIHNADKGVTNVYSPELSDSWGANFWCVIEQPKGQSFFANPETGECAWVVPSGTFVLPPRPEGQWWELFDETRKLSYYFHTKTKERQWERPKGFVIPLAAIQESTMGKRFSRIELKGESMAGAGNDFNADKITEESMQCRSQPHPPLHEPRLDNRISSSKTTTGDSHKQNRRTRRPPVPFTEDELWNMRRQNRSRVATGLSTIPSSTDLQAVARYNSKASKKKPSTRRRSTSIGEAITPLSVSRSLTCRKSFDLESLSSVEMQKPFRRERDPVKRRLNHTYRETFEKPSSRFEVQSPILQQFTQPTISQLQVGRKRSVSLDDRPIYTVPPAGLSKSFSYEAFARQRYATHRVGIFRRKCPIDRLMRWQKEPLRNPLLPLQTNEIRKDATRIFQVILRYCGDRVNPVFWPKVPSSSSINTSSSCRVGLCSNSKQTSTAKPKKDMTGPTVLEEVKWMMDRTISVVGLRNETYAQMMKQIMANEVQESLHKAWLLLCLLLSFISPSQDYLTPLHKFIQQNGYGRNAQNIKIMSTYCLEKLHHRSNNHPVKVASIVNIEAAEMAPFCPQLFNRTQEEEVMWPDASVASEEGVPTILSFLTGEMLKRNCLATVEVFRQQGDSSLVGAIQRDISKGSYTLQDLHPKHDSICQSDVEREVHVLANTLKLWLQNLKEPIFPVSLYIECLKASQDSSELLNLCQKLDKIHCRMLIYVVSFLQLFCTPTVIAKTKVNLEAISIIFASSFLRSPTQDLQLISNNLYLEKLFVENLLKHLPCHLLDNDFVPTFLIPGIKDNSFNIPTMEMNNLLIGIGGNGSGLVPRSRKASTCRS